MHRLNKESGYRMKEKKKFEFNYLKLDYHKKLIRTFIMGVIVILVPIICFIAKVPKVTSVVISVALLVLWSVLLIYNCVRYFLDTN